MELLEGAPIKQQILDILATIDRPGTFCASGPLPAELPGLEVTGVGPIALPLEKRQAAALKKIARQAPYGKGTRTLVDTDVRRVWEIDADQVALANPRWRDVLKQAVEATQSELGLGEQKLAAHLYKLLLYEPGSFFRPHRDGEKLDRMVATLVIALPSEHKGGELVVRHEGREQTVDFSPTSRFTTQFAAFYADCDHEIRPVTAGFRLALVYNLTLEKSKRAIGAPTSHKQIAAAAGLLGAWIREKPAERDANSGPRPPMLAVLLDHQYSQAGLTRSALKGVDRARADVLFAAAREAGCDASLALVTYWESGSAEPSDDHGYGYGRGRRYSRYNDESDDEFDDTGGGEHEMGEVFDSSLLAENFSDADENSLAFGQIYLTDEEIVANEPLGEGEPSREDFEGYTGNAGMTLDRWYHRAAVMLWPATARFDVLCQAGMNAAVGGLEQAILHWQQSGKSEREALQQECLNFARRIIANWPAREYASGYSSEHGSSYSSGYGSAALDDADETQDDDEDEFDDGDSSDVEGDDFDESDDLDETAESGGGVRNEQAASKVVRRPLLLLLQELGDASLIAAWIRDVLAKDASIDPVATLGDVCGQFGWATFAAELRELFDGTSNETIERDARLLADFALRKSKDSDRRRLCSDLAGRIVAALERWEPKPKKRDWQAKQVNLRALLQPLAQACVALEEPRLLSRVVRYVLDRPKEFDLTTIQVPTLLDLEPWLKRGVKHPIAPLQEWLTGVFAELESSKTNPPPEPKDWRREPATGCKCADCAELNSFLKDPNIERLRLPLAEQRRRHLHDVIDSQRLDTTHVTERRGRPYTLVCTKTKASHERAVKAYQLDCDHWAQIRKLLKWHQGL